MIFTAAGVYKTLVSLIEYGSAGYTSPTGIIIPAGTNVLIDATQENVKGLMEWGRLKNGNWIHLLQNGKPRVELVTAVTPTPPPPVTGKRITNIIDVYSDGTINVKPQ
jgi:hypothetical protein